MDCSPSGSSVHGISQARILEWVAISFSRRSFQSRDQTRVSCSGGRFFTAEPPGNPIAQYKWFQIPQMEEVSKSLLSTGLVTISLLLITLLYSHLSCCHISLHTLSLKYHSSKMLFLIILHSAYSSLSIYYIVLFYLLHSVHQTLKLPELCFLFIFMSHFYGMSSLRAGIMSVSNSST